MDYFARFTEGAKNALGLAAEYARSLGHNYVGTEHVLAGLLEEGGETAKILNEQGITEENVKDLILRDPNKAFSVRDFLRKPYFTYEYKKTSELMVEMRKDSVNFTIVLDEYGATVGMITLEDLLEEIVGDIRDEYDHDEEDPIRRIQDNEYQVLGSAKLDDLNEKLDLHLESEDYDSIGGYIIEHLDHLPKAGEFIVTEDGIRLVVDIVTRKRIDRVHIYLPPKKENEEPEEDYL